MLSTTIFTIFRESRGVVLLLMAVVLLVASLMVLTGLQGVEAKETTVSASVTEASALTDTTSPSGQVNCGPGPWLPYVEAACPDWDYWDELVASGWDGERQWFYYCTIILNCGRTTTLRCWVETE